MRFPAPVTYFFFKFAGRKTKLQTRPNNYLMRNTTNGSLEYLEMNKSEIISQLTEQLDYSKEKACQVFDFMTDIYTGQKPLRASRSQTDAYLEEALRDFPYSDKVIQG